MDLSIYFKILSRRKWLVVFTAVVAVVIVTLGTRQMPPTYEASTRLRIVPYSLGAPDYGSYIYFDRLANTYSDIVHSATVTDQAKSDLDLQELPDFDIQVIPQTELMRLSVTSNDPNLAQALANKLAALLIEQNQTSNVGGVQELLRERLDLLEAQINRLTVQYTELSNQIPRDNTLLTEIQRTLDGLQQNYNLLQNNANQAVISDIARSSALSVVEPAKLPEEPIGPNLTRNLIVAAIAGLAGGVVLAFLLESFNPLLYSDQQLESIANSNVIAHIPIIKLAHRNDVFTHNRIASEAFRRLRTHLLTQINQSPLGLLMVASAVPGEGKTTVASNLAAALAKSGRSVLLIDGNLQRPTLHQQYRLSNLRGLCTVLTGRAKLDEVVQESREDLLSVLCAGPIDDRSAELLSSDRFFKLLDEAVQTYEVIILDGPPVMASSIALTIAKQMSGIVWVIDPSMVDYKTFSYAHSQLAHIGTPLIGIVCNRIKKDRTAEWVQRYKPAWSNGVTIKQPKRNTSPHEILPL